MWAVHAGMWAAAAVGMAGEAPAHVSSARCFEWLPAGTSVGADEFGIPPPDVDWEWPAPVLVCTTADLKEAQLCSRTAGTNDRIAKVRVAEGCRLRWRWIAADVIPPVPPAAVLLDASVDPQERRGVCAEESGAIGTLAFGGQDGGVCFLPNGTRLAGPYKILLAEAPRENDGCGGEPAVQLHLATLREMIDKRLTKEDRDSIAAVTGSPFADLESALWRSDACVLADVLSHQRFVPHLDDLNKKGLHLLRSILAERLTDARREAAGLTAHPDAAFWSQNGYVLKDFDDFYASEGGIERYRALLEMASAGDPLPADLSFVERIVTHHPADTQYQLHVDTFHPTVKVWVYDDTTTIEDGPLRVVPGTHRNTPGKLKWMYNMTAEPRPDVVKEPSLRLHPFPGNPPDFGMPAEMAMVPSVLLPGAKRMMLVVDTSALHRRGPAAPGTQRVSLRPAAAEADGGVRRQNPFRLPVTKVREGAVRVYGCNTDCGRVEVHSKGVWRGVGAEGWSMREATVVCKELGFSTAAAAYAFTDRAAAGTQWGAVNCEGEELRLQDCLLEPVSAEDASVRHAAVTCLASGARGNSSAPPAKLHESTAKLRDAALQAAKEKATQGGAPVSEECPTTEWPAGVPESPLSDAAIEAAYTHADQAKVELTQAHNAILSATCVPAAREALADAFRAGARWTAAGIQLPTTAQLPPSLRSLVSADAHAPLHWDFDAELRWRPLEGNAASNKIAQDLTEDGIALVENWGLGDDALDSLYAIAKQQVASPDSAITSVASGGAVVTTRRDLPDLVPLLENETLREAIRSYLGEDVTLNGYKLTTLGSVLSSTSQYVAAKWHHDRVGRRLKMFVFLHDVACEGGRPTLVATGTHRIHFWRTESFAATRFNDAWVRENYPVVTACGKKGGGFIFDTHTLHRAGTGGDGSAKTGADRSTAIVEFHNAAKCSFVAEAGFPLPCPSGDQHMINVHF
eukprot:Hpha_TRINITY_DN16485_c2_g8::TRINITY_DN16485_c2_g8_i1::g.160458::m.160458